MKNINNEVFLNKIAERIKDGDFDMYLTLPFMTRELLFSSIKGRIDKKLATGGTPLLSDTEIRDCISETRETATFIVALYLKLEFMEKTETGFIFTEKGQKAIKTAYRS
jgi:hypothetical protein